tara:strand:- start:4188 stop:4532 length:345 start_codon:yes stop_codon:yes gene_type:complete
MTDYKEKYPIGSQWECRNGSRAVVVEHTDDNNFEVWISGECSYSFGVNGNWSDFGENKLDLTTPWKEKHTEQVEVVLVRFGDGTVQACFGSERDSYQGEVIARKKITITEGEGV